MVIIYSVMAITVLGSLFGLGLALAGKKLAVEKDPMIKAVEDIMPQTNCGACGFPGCAGYAVAIVEAGEEISLCPPGSDALIKRLAALLGKESVDGGEKMIARILCSGDSYNSKQKYSYAGITDCNQAVAMFGGSKTCSYGCVALGSCVRACAFDAIEITPEGAVIVLEDKCTGCTLCVPVCPKDIIEMVPARTQIYNSCSSHDKGGPVKKYCNVGCTACKLCEKACQDDAIHVKDQVAVFDYNKCTECGDCVVVCPTDSIQSWIPYENISDRAKQALADSEAKQAS